MSNSKKLACKKFSLLLSLLKKTLLSFCFSLGSLQQQTCKEIEYLWHASIIKSHILKVVEKLFLLDASIVLFKIEQ